MFFLTLINPCFWAPFFPQNPRNVDIQIPKKLTREQNFRQMVSWGALCPPAPPLASALMLYQRGNIDLLLTLVVISRSDVFGAIHLSTSPLSWIQKL